MTDTIQKTKKYVLEALSDWRFWLVVVGVSLVCVLSGPFGTFQVLPSGYRAIYWTLIVLLTSLVGLVLSSYLRTLKSPNWKLTLIVSTAFSGIASVIVIALGYAMLEPLQRHPGNLSLFYYSFPLAFLIFLAIVQASKSSKKQQLSDVQTKHKLLSRVKRYPNAKQILSLRAQDHYVEITTELGAELCLIRLSDAMSEAKSIDGIQVHRSAWVARLAIRQFHDKSQNPQIELTNGVVFNVSQSRVKQLRQYLTEN